MSQHIITHYQIIKIETEYFNTNKYQIFSVSCGDSILKCKRISNVEPKNFIYDWHCWDDENSIWSCVDDDTSSILEYEYKRWLGK